MLNISKSASPNKNPIFNKRKPIRNEITHFILSYYSNKL